MADEKKFDIKDIGDDIGRRHHDPEAEEVKEQEVGSSNQDPMPSDHIASNYPPEQKSREEGSHIVPSEYRRRANDEEPIPTPSVISVDEARHYNEHAKEFSTFYHVILYDLDGEPERIQAYKLEEYLKRGYSITQSEAKAKKAERYSRPR
jgi:hypothetical protein